ncbi:FAD-dependent oxidoreductase, partial [Aquabacterium sp.]|uniref:FAD-dependent oxidoreductase n=1 Tax=Aquabacterium sp. TaxID=1872578 RepID=UPI002BCB2119
MRVVVIGGGAVGSAVALFLKNLGGAAVEVQVVEPDPGLTLASSALSAGSIRQQFSNAINVRMSQFGQAVIGDAQAWLGVDDEPVDLGYVPSGYLFLAGEAGAPVLRAKHAVQQALDVPVTLLTPIELVQRFPWLNGDDLALASL